MYRLSVLNFKNRPFEGSEASVILPRSRIEKPSVLYTHCGLSQRKYPGKSLVSSEGITGWSWQV